MTDTAVMSERDKMIADLRTYRDFQEQAIEAVEKVTLDRAAEVVALYKNRTLDGEPLERRWQDELPALKPTRRRGGPKPDPDSFERFLKWATEVSGLSATTLNQFKCAHEVAEVIHAGGGNSPAPTRERALRPLGYFVREKNTDAIPGVWKVAADLARCDGKEAPSAGHVRLAVSDWKREHEPKPEPGVPAAKPGRREKFRRFMDELEHWLNDEPTLAIPAVRAALAEADARTAAVPPVEEW